MTQKDRVLTAIRRNGSVCVVHTAYWHPAILRLAARVADLKADGFVFTTRRCEWHPLSTDNHVQYELAPDDMKTLF